MTSSGIYEGKEILQPSLTNNPIVVRRVLFSYIISLDWNISAPTQYLLQYTLMWSECSCYPVLTKQPMCYNNNNNNNNNNNML
jgi:hypothetical protein